MEVVVLCVGKIKEMYLQNGMEACLKQLQKRNKVEMIEIPDEKTPDNASEKEALQIKALEGEKILSKIREKDYVITLCIEGTLAKDIELKKRIKKADGKRCIFVIGGSLGLDAKVVKRANDKLSFSRMTFPHQLMRYMLLEKLVDVLGTGDFNKNLY